eukprot:scaffold243_cov39-Attheya_sp.AAC.1
MCRRTQREDGVRCRNNHLDARVVIQILDDKFPHSSVFAGVPALGIIDNQPGWRGLPDLFRNHRTTIVNTDQRSDCAKKSIRTAVLDFAKDDYIHCFSFNFLRSLPPSTNIIKLVFPVAGGEDTTIS